MPLPALALGALWWLTKATTVAAVSYGTYRTADEMLMDGKMGDTMATGGEYLVNAGLNIVNGDESNTPTTELAQNFREQNGGAPSNGASTTQQQLQSSTSPRSITDQANQAATGQDSTSAQEEGDGLFDMVTRLMTGESNMGIVDDLGVAGLFGGAAKLFGAGNIKAGAIAALATALWTYREEIIGVVTNTFNSARDAVSPTNRQDFANNFVPFNSQGNVVDPRTSTPGNSFAALQPLQ